MATSQQRYYGNGLPVPEGIPGMHGSQEEWAAYRQKQAADKEASEALLRMISSQDAALSNPTMIQMAGPGESLQDVLTRIAEPSSPSFTDSSGSDAMAATLASSGGVSTTPAKGNVATNGMYPKVGAGKVSQEAAQQDPSADFLSAAFPEIFRKTPPQGIVNTTFGVERVNARTSETGVTAIKGPDGKVTLTNLGPNGQPNKGTGSPNSVGGNGMGTGMNQPMTGNQQLLMPNVSTSLQVAMRSLQDPNTTVDAALGHYANVQQEIALQQTKMQGDAIKFAETQFGIPDLNAQLQASLIADKNSPSWYPGIGDSPVTTRIRQAIQSATNDVQIAAQNYLKANTSYSALTVSAKTAELAMKQNEIRNNRKDAAQERVDINAAAKSEQKLQERVNLGSTLSPSAQARLMVINPTLATYTGDAQLAAMGDIVKTIGNDAAMKDYLQSPEHELPIMAISGNNYALASVMASETRGRPAASVQADIESVQSMVSDPKFAETAIRAKYPGADNKAAMEKELADLRTAKTGGLDAAGKLARKQADIRLALEMKRAQVAAAPVKDIRALAGAEGLLGDSIKMALNKTGDASIKNVLTAYLGDSSKDERIQKLATFQDAILTLGAKQPQSIFGMPNGALLRQAIVEASTVNSPWAAIDFLNPFKSNEQLRTDYPNSYKQ